MYYLVLTNKKVRDTTKIPQQSSNGQSFIFESSSNQHCPYSNNFTVHVEIVAHFLSDFLIEKKLQPTTKSDENFIMAMCCVVVMIFLPVMYV